MYIQQQTYGRKALALTLGLWVSHFFACSSKVNFVNGNKVMVAKAVPAVLVSASALPEQAPPELLKIKAFIGADSFPNDACLNPPGTHNIVSTFLVPVHYCVSGSSSTQPTTKICMLVNDVDTIPTEEHACWKSRSEFDPIAVLKLGTNYVRLFARDIQGNMASDGGGVEFRQGAAPLINILQPIGADIAYVPWKVGSTHTIKVEVTDDDSKFEDLKVIVSLVSKTDSTKFRHIGCSLQITKRLSNVLMRPCIILRLSSRMQRGICLR